MSKKRTRPKLMTEAVPQAVQAGALARYRHLLNGEEFAKLEQELAQPLRSALRLNPLKVEVPSAITKLASRYGWEVQAVPYCPTGWWIETAAISPSMTIEHRLGQYYIQDAASMLPVELFDLNDLPAPLILDMAASPGGKSTHIASRTHDRGLLIGNDSSRDRITALRLALTNWGALSAAVAQFPGEKYGAWFPETFDCVLLDAPCSMESLRSTPSHPMRPITRRERGSLAKRQTQLLHSALAAVRTGGQVVYSTCTLAPEEDEAILDRLLRQFPVAFEVQNVSRKLPAASAGLLADEAESFSPQVQNAVRLYPHHYRTSGFFAALLRKTAPIPYPSQPSPARPLAQTAFRLMEEGERRELGQQMLDRWGFDLITILETQTLSLWRHGERLFAFPEAFLSRFGDFPVTSLGLIVGEGRAGDFIPAIEWVSRFYPYFHSGKLTIPNGQVNAWLRGEDLPHPGGVKSSPGSVCIVQDEDGRLLGLGRVLYDRLRNLLPRRLVLA